MSDVATSSPRLDRYTTMGELSGNVCQILKRTLRPLAFILAAGAVYLAVDHSPGLISYLFMALGTLVALAVWSNGGIGVPLMPMIIVQQLVISGLPIITGHDVVTLYPESAVTAAGLEVLVFCLATTAAWRVGMNVFSVGSPLTFALVDVDREGVAGLARLGFGLVIGATAFLVLQSLDLVGIILQLLPDGVYPIIGAITAAASACGFFLLSMILGAGEMSRTRQISFWSLMICNCLISASSLLLSATAVVVASVVIGLFWSSGRIPWRFILITGVIMSTLNLGKYGMRLRYWHGEDSDRPQVTLTLTGMPAFYGEWMQYSVDAFSRNQVDARLQSKKGAVKGEEQTLFERLNNLQNLLYVIEAVEDEHISTLDGRTYAIIPPLLIPRLFWPDKPRTHEGQILLNVHFGRQLLESTFTTYVAWGLLAEAYGNFGAIKGSIVIGLALGLFFAWAEKYTSRKGLLSTEGFVAFAIFLGLANSYEMVASVMVTSIFQSLVPVVLACSPFVARKIVARPSE